MTGPSQLPVEAHVDLLSGPLATLLATVAALPISARPGLTLTLHGACLSWQQTPTHRSPWVMMTYLNADEAVSAVLAARPPEVCATWSHRFEPPGLAALRRASALRQLLGPWAAVELRGDLAYHRLIRGPCSVHRTLLPTLRLDRAPRGPVAALHWCD
ncbi:hypothetical protein K7W42_15255 [Deinococcus sp. HMF7604]|uniref:hypothetical protein n=1 Tax=Deinococcus betulae TaxID=2873312 RepID=UPI001CCAEFB2|nr:hypothetical protein [Deinococcus betulae]MBZ9752212.1 hypothetical protein [Deinococcus betulae]